jgi:hypothetical protein
MSYLDNVHDNPANEQGFFKPGVQPTGPNQQPHGPLSHDKVNYFILPHCDMRSTLNADFISMPSA